MYKCLMSEIGSIIYNKYGVNYYLAYLYKLTMLNVNTNVMWNNYDNLTQVNMMNGIWVSILINVPCDTLSIRLWLLPTEYIDAYITEFKDTVSDMIMNVNALEV